jgi:hypothetical protein
MAGCTERQRRVRNWLLTAVAAAAAVAVEYRMMERIARTSVTLLTKSGSTVHGRLRLDFADKLRPTSIANRRPALSLSFAHDAFMIIRAVCHGPRIRSCSNLSCSVGRQSGHKTR